MSLKDRVAQFSSITGLALGPEESAILRILQAKVDNLEEELKAKRERSSYLDEQLEQAEAEFRAQEKFHQDYLTNINQEMERFREGQKVLATFMEYIESDDFDIQRMRVEVIGQSDRFWHELKPYHDKGKELQSQLDELKDLRSKCVELREKTALMKNSD